jgi:hypothetical protein
MNNGMNAERRGSFLLLGKAYLQVMPWLTIFASYFVLGHPKTLDAEASEIMTSLS